MPIQIVERENDILIHTSYEDMKERINNLAFGNMFLVYDLKEHEAGELLLLPGGAKLYKFRSVRKDKNGIIKYSSPGGWWRIAGYRDDMADAYAGADALMSGCTTSTW